MPRPLLSRRIIFGLNIAVFVYSISVLAQSPAGQTAVKKTSSPTFKVVSAEYFPQHTDSAVASDADPSNNVNNLMDTVRYTLRNDSQKGVTAYDLEISYTSDGKPVGYPGGFGEDLTSLTMLAECLPPGADPGFALREMVIKSGDTYTHSIPANVDKEKLNGLTPSVHVRVVGVIWSDGTFEGEGFGLDAVKHDLDRRKKDAEAGAKVIAILDAHQDDPDIHHRIAEVAKAIQALVDEVPAVQKTSAGTTYGNSAPGAFIEPLNNIRIFESTPYPREALDAYSATYECRYKHLAAQLGPDASLEAAK